MSATVTTYIHAMIYFIKLFYMLGGRTFPSRKFPPLCSSLASPPPEGSPLGLFPPEGLRLELFPPGSFPPRAFPPGSFPLT